jgi:16S rRNA A1518/A1519 N6-dimethyltransferase RsmA/KsgA/DIM1 with predicted DNA glycosylase/AP lyase activity
MSFASRRKNIKNNLKKANLDWDQLDIDQSLRPEEVSLENYLKIAKHYQE